MSPLDLIVLGAFRFPVPQGSQVFAAQQACALARDGARVRFLSYGCASSDADEPLRRALARDGVRALAPRFGSTRAPGRAGPSLQKPVADLALLATLLRQQRRTPADVVLAHNVEAATIAAAARALGGAPFVYVAHTCMRDELPGYAPRVAHAPLARAGAALDALAARRADALIALTHAAAQRLAPQARGAVHVLPPGLERVAPPSPDAIRAACAAHGLREQGFVLHPGTLDAYQDLDTLAEIARALPALPFVAATHDRERVAPAPLLTLRLRNAEEGRALLHGAAACVLTRRVAGGFPVKLLNALDAARPVVLRAAFADTLASDGAACVLPDDAPPEAFVAALRALLDDPARARALGDAGRRALGARHDWAPLARATLEVARSAIALRAGAGARRPAAAR